jgi:2-dehydropantoate 2-reductase
MKVSVIGGGAIGLLISYFLKRNQHEPVIYTRSKKQAEQLNKYGMTYKNRFGIEDNSAVTAIPVGEYAGNESYCIVAVKQTSIQDLFFLRESAFAEVSYLFLQNGISHIKLLESLPQKNLAVGAVEHGAGKEGLTTVNHLGEGRIRYSPFRGQPDLKWAEILHSEEFPLTVEGNWKEMLYQKLIMNASINPVTALLRVPNGDLIKNEHALFLMKELFEEAIKALKMTYKREGLWKDLLILCRNTSLNRSSMLKSIERGEQTEIDSITGEIIERARNNNVQTPFSDFAYKAVKALDWRG